MNFVRVALDLPLPTLFDYRADAVSADDIGRRVLVPFGRKVAVGIIMEVAQATTLPSHRVRGILEILRDVAPLPADVLKLLEFCSDYYHHPLGEVVLNALPTRLRRRQRVMFAATSHCRLTTLGKAIDPESLGKRAARTRELLVHLRACPHGVDEAALRATDPRAGPALVRMLNRGWVERFVGASSQPDERSAGTPDAPELNREQASALASIRVSGSGFVPWLLFGVTGSGKTEVYLHAIADALARGGQVLMLVPEINLTPQLEALLRARFPQTRLVTLHSALNESERLHNWISAQCGEGRIVLGTRLAVFTPLPKLQLIVVDEEHDTSYKQMDGLRYSARDVAVVRAQRRRIPIVLGSATPSLESYYQALTGRYRLLELPRRVNSTLPVIECIDTRSEALVDGVAPTLLNAIRACLHRREQSLVFINRRGYAPMLICSGCGWTPGCERCSAKLVLHLKERRLRCHHCGYRAAVPSACPGCGNQDLTPVGHGTQRIESALARVFPDARLLRIDRDTTSRKGAWGHMRERIRDLEVDILVGTQIIAKGHDFPQLNLVGVINADSSLHSTDFRASERLYARLTQVAGRAGRGARPARVMVQTEFPAHPLYQALRRQDYASFARDLLAERKQAGFPPFMYQAVLRAEATALNTALEFLAQAAHDGAPCASGVTIYDPVPATMPRLAGVERAQLTVQSRSRASLHAFLRAWRGGLVAAAGRKVRWALDIDPLEI